MLLVTLYGTTLLKLDDIKDQRAAYDARAITRAVFFFDLVFLDKNRVADFVYLC